MHYSWSQIKIKQKPYMEISDIIFINLKTYIHTASPFPPPVHNIYFLLVSGLITSL